MLGMFDGDHPNINKLINLVHPQKIDHTTEKKRHALFDINRESS